MVGKGLPTYQATKLMVGKGLPTYQANPNLTPSNSVTSDLKITSRVQSNCHRIIK
jgi:predicted esterase YcpF (UPF0227 family)